MYDLAERIISAPSKSTPPKIGPSTYYLQSSKNIKENYVPFLSNTARVTTNTNLNTDALYNASIKTRIKGGGSIANKVPRFIDAKEDDTPGPCEYNPQRPGKRVIRQIVGKGRLYTCRVIYSVDATGLSIPTKLDENGYWINENDNLVKIPPTEHDESLGPAYYGTPQTRSYNSERYKGCRWSLSRTKRESYKIDDIPGPGTYNSEKTIKCVMNNPEDIERRALARQFSFVPRFAEAHEIKARKEALPAPCDYNPKPSPFEMNPSVSIKPRPFLNAAPRFRPSIVQKAKEVSNAEETDASVNIDSGSPGPGAYNVKYSNKEKKCFSMMRAPFGSLAVRQSFCTNNNSPGPATYSLTGPIASKLGQGYSRFPLAPFNKTAERQLSNVAKDKYYMPSPADYDIEPLWREKMPADSSQFRSRSKRTMTSVKVSCDANAATYNIIEPFRANTKHCSHYHGHAPFQQSRKRGPLFPTKFGPGPGDYRTETSLGGRGYALNTTPRFKDEWETVGPTTYKIHPKIDSCTYKANSTYNLRLKEFVLRKKLRLPPEETFVRWCKNLRKRKNLRWFYEYEMSLPKIKDYIKEAID